MRLVAGSRAMPYVRTDAGVLGGIGADFFSVRPGVHVRGVLPFERFHVDAIVGSSVIVFWPRGDCATFCEKTDLDCSDAEIGAEFGLGVGYRPVILEAMLGTGELPLWTFTAGVRLEL